MQANIVNIFPDVLPEDGLLFPLVQFFAEAVHTSTTENSPFTDQEELPPLADALRTQGLLRFHCPAPLGADAGRFLSLVQEMRQRPGDFAALALAGSGEAESRDAIISTVRRHAGRGEDEDNRVTVLWQARLVLQLAALTEQQEAEIQQSLLRIACREQEILSRLRDTDSPPVQHPAKSRPPDSRRTRLRLKAWRTLIALGGSPPPAGTFVTADQEAFELLLEECGAGAVVVVEAALPAIAAGEDFIAKRAAFRQEAAGLLENLPASFDKTVWNILLERHYPAERHGRRKLTLHFLPVSVLFSGPTALGFLAQPEQP